MTILAAHVFGMMYDTGFVPIDEAYVPDEPPPPYRAMQPKYDPFPSDHYLQVPVGSGMTYVSTGSSKHTALVGMVSNLNYNNWTDPYYTVTSSDPTSAGIEHREYLPAGWNSLTNAQTISGTAGPLKKKYTSADLRVPTAATWQSTSNTDRKVILNFDYDITLTTTIYESDGTTVASTSDTFYPAGTLQIETQKWQRVTSSTRILTTNLSKQNVYTGTGMTEGAVANGTAVIGYVRAWENALALAGDKFCIRHALKVGIANGNLLSGQLWPARTQDGDPGSYSGTIPYGTHIVLPASYDIEATGAPDYAKAWLYALRHYGAYVMIRAGSTGIMSFGVEPRSPVLNSTQANAIKAAINAAIPSLRISSNSNLTSGQYDPTTRVAYDSTLIAGGGTRITAGLGLDDLDDATGLKLPIDPDNLV